MGNNEQHNRDGAYPDEGFHMVHCGGQTTNTRSLPGGVSVYTEPDWSSLSLVELLEKAQEFVKQANGKSLSSYAFIERALDRMPQGTKGGAELAELMRKAQQVYKTIEEIQQSITHITETLSQ
jgi:proline racemase